jgi:hypothetical protein
MQANELPQGRVRRAVNDLVMAEMFLVQATIESATVVGESLGELGRQITGRDDTGSSPVDTLSALLQRVASDAVEPYTTRFRYLRRLGGGSA